MITLVAKDLRLSLDALRPTGLLLAAFLLLGAITLALPERLMPLGLPFRDVHELFIVLWTLVAYGSIAIPVWIVHAIANGDRMHGAASLAASMPVSDRSRGLARGAAMVGAGSLPAVFLALLAPSTESRIISAKLLRWWPMLHDESLSVAALSFGAVLIAIVMASSRRRLWTSMIVAHLLLLAMVPLTGLAIALGRAWTLARFGDGPHAWGQFNLDLWMAAAVRATAVGAAVVGLLLGAHAIRRIRSRRYAWWSMAVGSLAVLSIGVVAPRVAFALSSEKESAPTYRRWLATFASEDELLRTVERWGGGPASSPVSMGVDMELLEEASRRVRLRSPNEQASDPLTRAFRAALHFDDDARAYEVYVFTPFDRMDVALEWTTRFPRSLLAPSALVGELYRRKPALVSLATTPERNKWSAWAQVAVQLIPAAIDDGVLGPSERQAAEAAARALADALRAEVRP